MTPDPPVPDSAPPAGTTPSASGLSGAGAAGDAAGGAAGNGRHVAHPEKAGKPAASRRARVRRVEELMVSGLMVSQVCDAVGKEFGLSWRTVRSDIQRVRRMWAAQDRKAAPSRRAQTVRELTRYALQVLKMAIEGKARAGEVERFLRLRAQVEGLIDVPRFQVDATQNVLVTGSVADLASFALRDPNAQLELPEEIKAVEHAEVAEPTKSAKPSEQNGAPTLAK